MSAKWLMALVAGLIAGMVLGRIGPQADLRHARERIDELERQARERPHNGAGLGGVRSIFKVTEQDMEAGKKARAARERGQGTGTVAAAAGATGETTQVAVTAGASNDVAKLDHHSISNEVEKLKKAWQMRADIARTNFVSKAKLDEKQATDFDVLVEAMNLRIGTSIDKWSAYIKEQGKLTPETGVRMMTELGQAMVVTYDEMDRKMPPDWRQNAGSKFELVNFVDPEVLTPLQGLEGIADERGEGGGRRGQRAVKVGL